jgi:phenylacetate-CoA ligase
MTTIDRKFMAGLAYFLGLRKLKVGVIRVGAGIPELQWDSILKYKPSYLITVPSFLLKLIEYAEIHGIDYNNSSIKGAICIGESLRNQDFSMNTLSKKIAEKWNIKLFSTYASTEMSTAFTECEHGIGGHHHPELIIVEVLDENNIPVKNGEVGELAFTTLGIEAMPLLRFKTGDIVQLHDDPCTCGRNTLRVGPVIGRKKQMIKYKGTTLYPPAMNDVLSGFDNIENHIIEISTNDLGTDEILIKIAVKKQTPEFLQEIKDHFRAKLRVTPKIEFASKETLNPLVFNPMSRKPIRFFDYRN